MSSSCLTLTLSDRSSKRRDFGRTERWKCWEQFCSLYWFFYSLGALPTWSHSSGWGYFPSGGIGLVLAIVVVLLLMGRI